MGAHELTPDATWRTYKLCQAVEDIAWELPVTQAAIAAGGPLPSVYRGAAQASRRAWERYLEARRD